MVIYSATTVASFPGLPTAQFLIACSIEKLKSTITIYALLRIHAELNFEYIMSYLQTSTECRLTPHKVYSSQFIAVWSKLGRDLPLGLREPSYLRAVP